MPEKLLQKRRNKHLQQIPPENLMPNKLITRIKRGRRTSMWFTRMEQNVRNKWVFFWNAFFATCAALPRVTKEERQALEKGSLPDSFSKYHPPKTIQEKVRFKNLVLSLLRLRSHTSGNSGNLGNGKASKRKNTLQKGEENRLRAAPSKQSFLRKGSQSPLVCYAYEVSVAIPWVKAMQTNRLFLFQGIAPHKLCRMIVTPFAHILDQQIKQVVGGNIIQILNRCVVKELSVQNGELASSGSTALKNIHYYNKKGSTAVAMLAAPVFTCGDYGKNASPDLSYIFPSLSNEKTQKIWVYHLENRQNKNSICSIYWDKRETSAADFLDKQMQRYLYRNLYSLHEMSIKRNKIKDLHRSQYTECRKLGVLYGNISKRTLLRIMRYAQQGGGNLDTKFLSALERRLDVVLKRILFFPTIKTARQWINQGHILVNKCVCTTPGYLLQPADCIHIRKKVRTTWKMEWWKHFSKRRNLTICPDSSIQNVMLGNKNADKKELIKPKQLLLDTKNSKRGNPGGKPANAVHFTEGDKERRFLFSPSLLGQWKRWSGLWGKSSNRQIKCSSGNDLEWHKWAKNSNQWMQSVHSFFQKSAFAGYYNKTQVAYRKKTIITTWLKKLYGYHGSLLDEKTNSFHPSGKAHLAPLSLQSFLWKKRNGRTAAHATHGEGNKANNTFFLRKCMNAAVLHRQQTLVTDGLYAHRWNKVFVKRKQFLQKRKHWRYSCIKPMHVECSYKHGSAIFLYASQKLAWPSSINVFLLRKALV